MGWFSAAVLLRDAALLWLMALVVWEILRLDRDVVRLGGVDDPAGGLLDGVPDRHEPADGATLPVLPGYPAPNARVVANPYIAPSCD